MKRAILATGGMDSTVLLYSSVQLDNILPTVITVDYGHAAFDKQLELLKWHCSELELADPVVIHISFPPWQCEDHLFCNIGTLKDDTDTTDALYTAPGMRYEEMFIEGRNATMLIYAMAYCSAHKIDELQTGYLYSDDDWKNRRAPRLITGDNSPQFVDAMNLLSMTGFSHQIRIRAPYYEEHFDKALVVKLGRELGVDFSKTHSCYWPTACGVCDNCLLRKEVLGEV